MSNPKSVLQNQREIHLCFCQLRLFDCYQFGPQLTVTECMDRSNLDHLVDDLIAWILFLIYLCINLLLFICYQLIQTLTLMCCIIVSYMKLNVTPITGPYKSCKIVIHQRLFFVSTISNVYLTCSLMKYHLNIASFVERETVKFWGKAHKSINSCGVDVLWWKVWHFSL